MSTSEIFHADGLVWPAEAVWEAVVADLPGFSVEILPCVDSTNTELMRRARAGQCEPVVLVAERQTAGRGRMGRDWHSDPNGRGGSLTLSLGLALEPVEWSGLSLAVGLAVAQALHPDVQLKWPNDLWWQGRKLAGILIETASVGAARYAVIGLGVNMHTPEPVDLRNSSVGLQELVPTMLVGEAFFRVVPPMVRAILAFASHGFAPSQAAFQQRDALRGRDVVLSDGTGGVARGVDGRGALLVHTAAGVIQVSSAEVSVRPVLLVHSPT